MNMKGADRVRQAISEAAGHGGRRTMPVEGSKIY